jgi:glyoxylase-like metal-dependent hydrolase (beta-lactamase superfamily II)
MEILPNIHMLDDPSRANCYLIVGDGEPTMIDVGMKGDVAKVSQLLRQNGVEKGKLRNIVITHAHSDHYQGAAAVKANEGGKLMVHEADAVFVDGSVRMPLPHGGVKIAFILLAPLIKSPPAAVDVQLNEGDVIKALGGLQVLHLPGHTPGNIALYSKKRKVLFCGDTLGNRDDKLSVPFQYKYHKEECDASFERLASMDIDALLPGHGPPILKGAKERLEAFAASIK